MIFSAYYICDIFSIFECSNSGTPCICVCYISDILSMQRTCIGFFLFKAWNRNWWQFVLTSRTFMTYQIELKFQGFAFTDFINTATCGSFISNLCTDTPLVRRRDNETHSVCLFFAFYILIMYDSIRHLHGNGWIWPK